MDIQRLQRIDSLLKAALDLDPGERTSMLDEACPDDPELRREVESLISLSEKYSGFIEGDAVSEAIRLLASKDQDDPALAGGASFDHYTVLALIGQGGMARVYLARDTKLYRNVALKLLRSEIATDDSAIMRFRQEARAASALNHPNIVTIYEIGRANETHFIAAEFIDGDTLRRRIRVGPLPIGEALRIASEVGAALSQAHRAGIVHRDIKPENIMLRPDGCAKVVDFGLAKLAHPDAPFADHLSSSAALITVPGVILGTISYMSPEQARGVEVDYRSDIWSLGVVLFEMIAGRIPFEGATPTDLIISIVEKKPASLSDFAPDAPEELAQIIGRCLEKEPGRRYRNIDELLRELEEVRDIVQQRQAGTPSRGGRTGETARPVRSGSKRRRLAFTTGIASLFQQHRVAVLLFGAAILLAIGALLWGWPARPGGSVAVFRAAEVQRLTTSGDVRWAALSPDGSRLAYVVAESEGQGLKVKNLASAEDTDLVPVWDLKISGLTFSPAGDEIYYVANDALYRSSIDGGSRARIIEDVNTAVTFAPDGSQFAFVRGDYSRKQSAIVIAGTNGGEQRILSKLTTGFTSYYAPAWSPDGTLIAAAVYAQAPSETYMELVAINVADGTIGGFGVGRHWNEIAQIAWLGDGSGLIVSATEQKSTLHKLYEVAYPSGEVQPITRDLGDYFGASLSANSSSLVSLQREDFFDLFVGSQKNGQWEEERVTTERGRLYPGLSWIGKDRIVYTSNETGNPDIYAIDTDGRNRTQLTRGPEADTFADASADGKYVVFVSDRSGSQNIWRINADGGNPKQLSQGAVQVAPQCLPDNSVIFTSLEGGSSIKRVSILGGDPVSLDFGDSRAGVVSPDGRSIVCWHRETSASPFRVAVFSLENQGKPPVYVDIPILRSRVKWSPEGQFLTYVASAKGLYNVALKPVAGGPPQQLTVPSPYELIDFAWSRDGQKLALIRGRRVENAVLLKRAE